MAVEVSNNETPRPNHDNVHLVPGAHHHDTVGHLLRPGGHLHGRPGDPDVHRGVAGLAERRPLLPHRQHDLLLHPAHDPHHHVLRAHLDQSVEAQHPHRHQRRADGAHAAEVES